MIGSLVCLFFALIPSFVLASFPALKSDSHLESPKPALARFTGLILLKTPRDLNPAGYQNVQGVLAYHIDLPGSKEELAQMLKPLKDRPLTTLTAQQIKAQVLAFYQKNHRPIVRVKIPNQNFSFGTVQLIIQEGKLGTITVEKTRWSRPDIIKSQIHLPPNQPIALNTLNQDLYWLNRSPFRQINAILLRGEKPNTTDLHLTVQDRFPLRLYAGVDNSGNDATGTTRLITGLNWGNICHTNQSLAYQFIASYEFDRLRTHLAFYNGQLPWWHHAIAIYGGYLYDQNNDQSP